MAKFISISGPVSTGKTTIVEALRDQSGLSDAVICPDIYKYVWDDLVDRDLIDKYTELHNDSEYICVYLTKLMDYYKSVIDKYKDTDKLVIFDGSWIDLSVYGILNMWFSRTLKDLQTMLLSQLNTFDDSVSRIYFTQFNEYKQSDDKYVSTYRMWNMKHNRPLEIQYYEFLHNLKTAVVLPDSSVDNIVKFIVKDLEKLGYI